MFSVLLLEEGEYVFKGFCKNSPSDIFAKTASEKLGWDVPNIKLYSYSDAKLVEFIAWLSDGDRNKTLYVNPINGNLEKITQILSKYVEKKVVSPSDVDASNYYTAQELADYASNLDVDTAWNIANPDPQPGVTGPDYAGVVSPSSKIVEITHEAIYTVEDTIVGTLVDIPARIIAEQAALDAGLTQLP